MNCTDVRESLETYIVGDVDDAVASEMAEHLRSCGACAAEYDRVRDLIGDLKELREVFVPREVFDMSAIPTDVQPRSVWRWKIATLVAALVALLAVSVLAVPALAETLKVLPVSDRINELKAENKRLEGEVDALEIKIKEIEGQKVPVVETAEPPLSVEENNAIQSLAMRFINAQYAGDMKTMKELATDKLKADLVKHPKTYLRTGGPAVFAQMTDVSMSGSTYLLFIRLMDAGDWNESQYQENFEIIKVGDTYLIDSVGMDA